MIDVSASIYNALPRAYNSYRPTSEYSLVKPDSSLEAGNSLRAVAENIRPKTDTANFAPRPANEQGFASLGPALSSLRLPPQQLAVNINSSYEPATYEKLLEIQEEITQSRAEQAEAAELREQARQQAAADLEINQARARSFREKAVFRNESSIETEQLPDDARQQFNSPQPTPILGQNDSAASDIRANQTENLFTEQEPEPAENAVSQNNDTPIAQRERIQQLFNTEQTGQNSASNISIFA